MKKSLFLALGLTILVSCGQNTTNIDNPLPPVPSSTEEDIDVSTPPEELQTEVDDSQEETKNQISQGYYQTIARVLGEEHPILTSNEDEYSEYFFPLMQFDPDLAQGYAISLPAMAAQAYGIAVILPVVGQEETVLEGLQFFIDNKVSDFTGYSADQLEIAENALLETLEDGRILMVMCQNHEEVFKQIAHNE
ncbi:MAG: DUF4358 domain-containing protein [Eubacteriales bacterium]